MTYKAWSDPYNAQPPTSTQILPASSLLITVQLATQPSLCF